MSTDSGRSAKGQAKKLLISSHHWVHCRKQLFKNEKCCYSAYFPLLTAQEFLVAILCFPFFFHSSIYLCRHFCGVQNPLDDSEKLQINLPTDEF